MKRTDENIQENMIRKIKSIMREQSTKKLTVHRQYLPEIFDANLFEIYEGLPIIKPYVEKFFRYLKEC